MISFPAKNSIRARFSRKTIFLGGLLFVLLAFGNVFPSQAHAQTATPTSPANGTVSILAQNLTPANGWTCSTPQFAFLGVAGPLTYTCTNTNTQLGTAKCTESSSADTVSDTTTCQLIDASGATTGVSTDNYSAGGQTSFSSSSNPAVANENISTVSSIVGTAAQCVAGGATGIAGCIIGLVAYLIFQIAATILGFVGLIFNWVVTVTVFEFGLYFANSPGMLVAWGILRDIGNIVILFGFILMGIMMILDLHNFEVRKTLPRLLIFAVLLNFSLFASEAIVDVSNSLSAAFYQAAGDSGNCSGNAGLENKQCTSVGIAGTILTASGLSTVWTSNNAADIKALATPDGAIILILLAVFLSIAAIVLLAGAIMIFIRAITLAFLLVVSPLGFAGMAIPQFQKQANVWWKKLIEQAFFAPIFFLLIFVALKLTSIIQVQGGGGFLAAITPGTLNIGLIFLFLLVFGFMIAALIVSKSFSATGADFAISTSATLTAGTAGFIGRRTVGRGANAANEYLGKTAFGRSRMGQFVRSGLKSTAGASFDLRSSKFVTDQAKKAKLDLGKAAGKGGYAKIIHDTEKKNTDYAKTLTNTKFEKNVIGEIDTQINRKRGRDQAELRALDAQHRADRIPLDDQVRDRQLEVAEARARGDQAALGIAELGLNNARLALQELREEQTRTRGAIEAQHKSWIEAQEAAKKSWSQAPQREFAHTLEHSNPIMHVTAGPAGDHHAAETILKDLGKNETQKLIDALGGVQAGLNNPPAAAAAPAGGGGAPAAGAAPPPAGGGAH